MAQPEYSVSQGYCSNLAAALVPLCVRRDLITAQAPDAVGFEVVVGRFYSKLGSYNSPVLQQSTTELIPGFCTDQLIVRVAIVTIVTWRRTWRKLFMRTWRKLTANALHLMIDFDVEDKFQMCSVHGKWSSN